MLIANLIVLSCLIQNIYYSPFSEESEDSYNKRFAEFLLHSSTPCAIPTLISYSSKLSNSSSSIVTSSIHQTAASAVAPGVSNTGVELSQSTHDSAYLSRSTSLLVYGHTLHVPVQATGRRTARFSFQSLCGQAYGPADFIELARIYQVIFLSDIPRMDLSHKNEVNFYACSFLPIK